MLILFTSAVEMPLDTDFCTGSFKIWNLDDDIQPSLIPGQDDAGIDSCDEESDEEFSLCNKVCTYTVTQKDFMNQHWSVLIFRVSECGQSRNFCRLAVV